MRTEKVDTKKENKKKEKITVKSYIRDFLLFIDKNIIKTIGILAIVAVLLFALSIQPMVKVALTAECEGACRDGVTLISEYWSKIQVLFVTAFAGIVPYIYAPVVGFIGYVLSEASSLAYIIKGYGYGLGIVMGIVPLLLNVVTICIVTALGIYICRTVTVGYRMSSVKNMNFMNFKIKLYEAMQKENKVKELETKKEKKLEKLQAKKQKINYLQLLNTGILVCIIQFISVLIQQILL